MDDSLRGLRLQVARQVAHWTTAASRLRELESLASPEAWAGMERYLGTAIRGSLLASVDRLEQGGVVLQAALDSAQTEDDLERVRRELVGFRTRYLRAEATLDFYADAINTRTNAYVASLLRACDVLAGQSMFQILDPRGKPTPLVLTYLDKGLGASILKAGMRLWDEGTESPVAAIKIVQHNLYRPTALIHEAGHQVAHIIGWNDELASNLARGLDAAGSTLAETWASWASEIAADTVAFVQTGYAAVAGLHDVLAGDEAFIFRYIPGDPHPISYIRVLLGIEMCRQYFGSGPWDDLAWTWAHTHPLAAAEPEIRAVMARSLPLLPRIVEVCLQTPMQAFGGKPLTALVHPERVRPEALLRLDQQIGPALYTSPHWVFTEGLRLLALTGYRAATLPEQATEILKQQEAWMLRLGATLKAA